MPLQVDRACPERWAKLCMCQGAIESAKETLAGQRGKKDEKSGKVEKSRRERRRLLSALDSKIKGAKPQPCPTSRRQHYASTLWQHQAEQLRAVAPLLGRLLAQGSGCLSLPGHFECLPHLTSHVQFQAGPTGEKQLGLLIAQYAAGVPEHSQRSRDHHAPTWNSLPGTTKGALSH